MRQYEPSHAKAVTMSLYPTFGSTQEVVSLALSKLPVMDQNTMISLLASYHNTLIQELTQGN